MATRKPGTQTAHEAFSRRQVELLLLDRLKNRPHELSQLTDRVQAVVASLGGLSAASQVTGLAISTINNWGLGTRSPSAKGLSALANAAKVRTGWLISGEGEPFQGDGGTEHSNCQGDSRAILRPDFLRLRIGGHDPKLRLTVMGNDSMAPLIQKGANVVYEDAPGGFSDEGVYALEIAGTVVVRDIWLRREGALQATCRNNPPGRPPEIESWRHEDSDSGIKILGRVRWFDTVL